MIYAPLFVFCIVLFELFALLKMGTDAMAIIARSQEAMRVLRSVDLGDDEKEVFMRRGSADIFMATVRFAAKLLLIGVLLYLLFLLTVTLFPDLKEGVARSFLLSGRHCDTDGRHHVLCVAAQARSCTPVSCSVAARWSADRPGIMRTPCAGTCRMANCGPLLHEEGAKLINGRQQAR